MYTQAAAGRMIGPPENLIATPKPNLAGELRGGGCLVALRSSREGAAWMLCPRYCAPPGYRVEYFCAVSSRNPGV